MTNVCDKVDRLGVLEIFFTYLLTYSSLETHWVLYAELPWVWGFQLGFPWVWDGPMCMGAVMDLWGFYGDFFY